MALHYNAFISYRHQPDDIRVAEEIHRRLERFKVPKALRQKHGKIERIFRDKDELPITSNLTGDISSALRNSDFLIVICSVHTRESIWVQREIELFLKTHSRDRILTVLVSGEPYDVIPEILLYDQVQDPVTGEIQKIPLEPLSCDWRINHRQAIQNELPRLAAALLGCGYDELRQRQKQYQVRRNMAIVSTALAASLSLTAYFLYTSITIQKANEQIQANLNEALINQSRHLATAAQERLDDGDRLTAIALAMAALPGKNNPRPYVPEAENVLISALGIYNTMTEMSAVGTVGPGSNTDIINFWVTDSESVIYIYDQKHFITAWDTFTFQELGTISLEDQYFTDLIPLDNDNALILADSTLSCYQADGTLVWEQASCIDAAFLAPEKTLLLIRMLSLSDYELLRLDPYTGAVVSDPIKLESLESGLTPYSIMTAPVLNEVPVVIRFSSFGQAAFCAVDLASGSVHPLSIDTDEIARTCITRDGKLLTMSYSEGLGLGGLFEGNRVTTPATTKIRCYRIQDEVLLWETEISSSVPGLSAIEEIPESSNLLCVIGNTFKVLNAETGETLADCNAGSGIISISVGTQYTSAVLQDGYTCYFWYSGNYCYEVKCMKDNVDIASVGEHCYASYLYDDHVTIFRKIEGSPLWKVPLGASQINRNCKTAGQYLAFLDYSTAYLFDTDSKSLIWSESNTQMKPLGFSGDGTTLWCLADTERLVAVDTATGASSSLDIPLDENTEELASDFFLADDLLHYVIKRGSELYLVRLNLITREKQSLPFRYEDNADSIFWSWKIAAADSRRVWLQGNRSAMLELDLSSEQLRCIAGEYTQNPVIATDSTGSLMALANQGTITLIDSNQADAVTVTLDDVFIGSLYFQDSNLLALCDNGYLYRFDASGTLLSQTKLEVASDFGYQLRSSSTDLSAVNWHFTQDNLLILNALGTGNIIDCASWKVRSAISYFLMYSETDHMLICDLIDSLGGYPIYETAELLKIARQELNCFQLTQDQKASYGIE